MGTDTNTNATHTSGPWELDGFHEEDDTVRIVAKEGGAYVCDIALSELPADQAEDYANARLIAAAPEMLAALRLCAQFVSNATLNDGIGNTLADGTVECLKRHEAAKLVSAAIARAVGENASGKATPG